MKGKKLIVRIAFLAFLFHFFCPCTILWPERFPPFI
jgi:hypothetical protein